METTDFPNGVFNGKNMDVSLVRGKRKCEQLSISQGVAGSLLKDAPHGQAAILGFIQANSSKGGLPPCPGRDTMRVWNTMRNETGFLP